MHSGVAMMILRLGARGNLATANMIGGLDAAEEGGTEAVVY